MRIALLLLSISPAFAGILDLGGSGGGGGSASATTPGGSDTQVQFNDGSAFGGDAGLIYNKTSDFLGVGAGPTPGGRLHISSGSVIIDGNVAKLIFGTVGTGLYIDNASNFLGVGTSNPLTRLDVNGTSSLRGASTIAGSSLTVTHAASGTEVPFILLRNTNGSAGDKQSIRFENVGFAGASSIISELNTGGGTASLYLNNGSGNILRINATGVGINKDAVAADLDVNGAAVFRDGITATSTAAILGNAFSVGTSTFVVTASSVGVRNANPSAALDVNGETVSRGQFTAASSATVIGAFRADTNTLVVDDSNDRVGIGKSNPATKAHLSSGTLTIDGTGVGLTSYKALGTTHMEWLQTPAFGMILQGNATTGNLVFMGRSSGSNTPIMAIGRDQPGILIGNRPSELVRGVLQVAGSGAGTVENASLRIDTATLISPETPALLVDGDNGRVGLGYNNPQEKLHVSSGTMHFSGTGSPTTGGALCINTAGQLTKCTSIIDASGNCTCP